MYAGGILGKDVHSLTLFDTIEQNNAFLTFYVGDGMCENFCCYSKVDVKERSGDHDPSSLNHNGDEYGTYLQRRRAAMKGTMSWKDG